MRSSVKAYKYENGEIQRVHTVILEKGEAFHFFKPKASEKAFERICDLYKNFAVPKCPIIFGRLLHFCLPQDIKIPKTVFEIYESFKSKYGAVSEDISKVTVAFKEGLRIDGKGNVRERRKVKKLSEGALLGLFEELQNRGCARVVCGKMPYNKILPVGNDFGLLSESEPEMDLKANATFFIMDSFDVASVYDVIGTSFGFTAEEGEILTPPLYAREAFLVKKNGSACIERLKLNCITIKVKDKIFANGKDGTVIFERPKRAKTPAANKNCLDLAIVGRKIIAIKKKGGMQIPAAGFVLRIRSRAGEREIEELLGEEISYGGVNDIEFAVSAGNSIIVNGEKTLKFKSAFYNIKRPWKVKYPPTLYPLDFENARAPRMAIGAKKDGSLVILWAEGKGKFTYEKGVDSCGASLREMADICADLGIFNAVNLDGGGSAQILTEGKRLLKISDRNKENNTEAERAVPLGLGI